MNNTFLPVLGSTNPEHTEDRHVAKWYVAINIPTFSAPKIHPPNAYQTKSTNSIVIWYSAQICQQ